MNVVPDGALHCPSTFVPQQVAEPPVVIPHVKSTPAEMLMNVVPTGTFIAPEELSPQHKQEPLVSSPHACWEPAEISANCTPAGTLERPCQHTPSRNPEIPHVFDDPAEIIAESYALAPESAPMEPRRAKIRFDVTAERIENVPTISLLIFQKPGFVFLRRSAKTLRTRKKIARQLARATRAVSERAGALPHSYAQADRCLIQQATQQYSRATSSRGF